MERTLMNRKRLMVLGALSAIGLGTAGGVYAGHQIPTLGAAPAASVLTGNMGLVGSMGHGWHGKRHHGGPGRFCAGARGEKLEHAIDFVQSFVDFTPEQDVAWQDFTAALVEGRERVRAACDELDQAENPMQAPDALARAESMLTAGLEVVREVRSAFDRFYDTLSDDQKQALDQLVNRHRRS